MRISDWSSDVCSSDLKAEGRDRGVAAEESGGRDGPGLGTDQEPLAPGQGGQHADAEGTGAVYDHGATGERLDDGSRHQSRSEEPSEAADRAAGRDPGKQHSQMPPQSSSRHSKTARRRVGNKDVG